MHSGGVPVKPALLFVSGHLPAEDGGQAGMKSSYHLCRVLARSFDIHALCFVTQEEMPLLRAPAYDVFQSMQVIPVNHWRRAKGALRAPLLPLSISARNSVRMRQLLKQICGQYRFDVAVLDHTAIWQYADELCDIPVLCGVAHDVMTQLWERRAVRNPNPVLRYEAHRMRRWESRALAKLDVAVPFSEKDGMLFRQLSPETYIHPIQPWFNDFTKRLSVAAKGKRDTRNLLFWGALGRQENQDCVSFILDEVLPQIQQQVPDVHLYIAGGVSEDLKAAWSRPGVTVTGFVQDVAALFAQMDIALLPLRLGAGIKIKVLESMSAGLAVVTSEVGIEGIPAQNGVDFLLADSAPECIRQVAGLLADTEAANILGRNAQEFIRAHFDFDRSASELAKLLADRRC